MIRDKYRGPTSAIALALAWGAAAILAAPAGLSGQGTGARSGCADGSDGSAGVLAGTVRDGASGVPLPGATVTVWWEAGDASGGQREATSGSGGAYRICGLPSGRAITAQAGLAGFAGTRFRVTLSRGSPVTHDLLVNLASTGPAPGRVAASGPGRIVGTISDRETGRPVEAATISVAGEDREALSGAAGRFMLGEIPPGDYRLRIHHVAYGDVEQPITVLPARTVEVTAQLTAHPIEVAPLVVTALRDRRLEIKGFYERKEIAEKTGRGFFFTREQIQRRQPRRVTDLLGDVPGIRLDCGGRAGAGCTVRITGGQPSLSRRGQYGCVNSNIFVDGVRVIRDNQAVPSYIDDMVIPAEIVGIEVYRGAAETPAEYGGSTGRCGAIVIWTGGGAGS